MSGEIHFWDAVQEIRRSNDERYAPEAYGFVMDALEFTIHRVGERRHVSAAELLENLCDHAMERFGVLAYSVLENWGLRTTDDVGETVFQLVEAQVLSRREKDSRDDFHDAFDLRRRLEEGYFEKS
jgi:uncharacterized repeat protein (TIGR04138 family)